MTHLLLEVLSHLVTSLRVLKLHWWGKVAWVVVPHDGPCDGSVMSERRVATDCQQRLVNSSCKSIQPLEVWVTPDIRLNGGDGENIWHQHSDILKVRLKGSNGEILDRSFSFLYPNIYKSFNIADAHSQGRQIKSFIQQTLRKTNKRKTSENVWNVSIFLFAQWKTFWGIYILLDAEVRSRQDSRLIFNIDKGSIHFKLTKNCILTYFIACHYSYLIRVQIMEKMCLPIHCLERKEAKPRSYNYHCL